MVPDIWKEKLVVPVPKKKILKDIKDMRKIACPSDYCKIFEGFLTTWILEDISEHESYSHYEGKSGIGAEHMLVCMVDRILNMLETTKGHAAVISSQYDLMKAFDGQDPTKTIQNLLP